MLFRSILLAVSAHFAVAVSAAAQGSDSAGTVRSFYTFDQRSPQAFDHRNLDLRRKWLSPRLYELFREELRKQDEHLKKNPDEKPFFGDGFPFRPIDEPCEVNGRSLRRRFATLALQRQSPIKMKVPVRFFYPKPCTLDAITYTTVVVRSGSKWLIDDIIFDDGSRLAETMKNHKY